MRTLIRTAGALAIGLAFAATANAAAILQAIEQNAAPIAATSNLTVSGGDTFLLEVSFVGEALPSAAMNAEQIDIVWDTAGVNTLDAGAIVNNAGALGLIGGATGAVLGSQGDFNGAQASALRISSGFTFGPFPFVLNGSGGTILMTVDAGIAPGVYNIDIGFNNSPIANSLVPSGAVTNFTYTVVPEPAMAMMLGLGLFGLAAAGRRR